MNLYLDANILVDVALRRVDEKGTPLWIASTLLLDEIYRGKNRGSTSVLSLYVVYVLVNPKDTRRRDLAAKQKLQGFKRFLTVVNLTDDILEESFREGRLMFEDAVQSVTSKKISADAIVTRDIRHFKRVKDEVKILTPEELTTR